MEKHLVLRNSGSERLSVKLLHKVLVRSCFDILYTRLVEHAQYALQDTWWDV